jgi:hypothetical protein
MKGLTSISGQALIAAGGMRCGIVKHKALRGQHEGQKPSPSCGHIPAS